MVDGLMAAVWLAGLMSSLTARDAASLAAMAARMAAAAIAVYAGWQVTQRTAAGPWLAGLASLVTGAVMVAGLSSRTLPSNFDPAMRDLAAAAYALAAIAIVWWARRTMRAEHSGD